MRIRKEGRTERMKREEGEERWAKRGGRVRQGGYREGRRVRIGG